jgi:hypothetical protein
MPLAALRALSVDRGYYADAHCRTPAMTPKAAWLAESGRRYSIGGHSYRGEKLIELALLGCATCPVQWKCAAAAIEADERAGIWADSLDNLRWLARETKYVDVLEMAESTGVTVQRTIVMLRSHLT